MLSGKLKKPASLAGQEVRTCPCCFHWIRGSVADYCATPCGEGEHDRVYPHTHPTNNNDNAGFYRFLLVMGEGENQFMHEEKLCGTSNKRLRPLPPTPSPPPPPPPKKKKEKKSKKEWTCGLKWGEVFDTVLSKCRCKRSQKSDLKRGMVCGSGVSLHHNAEVRGDRKFC